MSRESGGNRLYSCLYCVAPGCKRIIIDPGYLKCLNQPNVSLKYDAIDAITQGGIKLQTGEEVALDVIIFGTGYQLVSPQSSRSGIRDRTELLSRSVRRPYQSARKPRVHDDRLLSAQRRPNGVPRNVHARVSQPVLITGSVFLGQVAMRLR